MEATLEPLPGGWSGETFLAAAGDGAAPTVVRVYGGRSLARGPQAPEVDAAVLALVRGLLPVPDVLEVRRADEASGTPGLLVTACVPGERGDLVLPRLDGAELARLGSRLGHVAGVLATMPQRAAGPFLDGTLRVGSFGELADLAGFAASYAPRLPDWSPDDLAGLDEVVAQAGDLLDEVPRRTLVHGDLNPKNVLVDPDRRDVVAVLDWEFAHAGHPAADLGNLLRHERRPGWTEAVLGAYRDRVPAAEHDRLLDRARAADLPALLDLAVRRGANPEADRAHDLLLAVARSRDLHAGEPG